MSATPDASAAAERLRRQCGKAFTPRKPWAVFCGPKCRTTWHEQDDGALRAVVSSVRLTKRGGVSMIVRFDPMDRDAALGIDPGAVVEISK
jgi:hypothetical protein